MAILNLDGGSSRGPRFGRPKIWLGVAILAGVLGIGSTLASTITLNSGTPTEFGQGATRTVYCGGTQQELTITPIAGYSNDRYVGDQSSDTATAYAGSFVMTGFKVSHIPENCNNIDFIISAYDNGATSSPLNFLGSQNSEKVNGLAVLWEGDKNGIQPSPGVCANGLAWTNCVGAAVRINNSNYSDSGLVYVRSVDGTEFTVSFGDLSGSFVGIPTDILGRLVIETQADQMASHLGSNPLS